MSQQGLFDDSPGDFERKIFRMFGVLDEAPCDLCETVRPIAKLNVVQMPSDEEEPPQRYLLCDECLREKHVGPVSRRVLAGLGEPFEESLAEGALAEHLSEEERQASFEALEILIRSRQEQEQEGEGD